MTLSRTLMLVPVAISLWASSASAASNIVVIGFDDVEAPSSFLAQTVQLTDQYAALGVTFTNPPTNDTNEIVNNSTFIVPATATSPNFLASLGFRPIEGFFTVPVFYVGALIGVSGGSDQLRIFDAAGSLIGSVVGDDAFVSLTSTAPIARFTVTPFEDLGATIDNLTFEVVTEVPEPSSLLMGATGLLALLGWKRNRT